METVFIIILSLACYLILSIISFNPLDSSWSLITSYRTFHNLGGKFGAYLADIFLLIFGVLAYLLPLLIIYLYLMIVRQYNLYSYIDYFDISLRLIGSVLLLCSLCGLAEFYISNILYFNSGGIIGFLIKKIMLSHFNKMYDIVILLLGFIVGINLYARLSVIKIINKIRRLIILILVWPINKINFNKNKKRKKNFLNKLNNSKLSSVFHNTIEEENILTVQTLKKSNVLCDRCKDQVFIKKCDNKTKFTSPSSPLKTPKMHDEENMNETYISSSKVIKNNLINSKKELKLNAKIRNPVYKVVPNHNDISISESSLRSGLNCEYYNKNKFNYDSVKYSSNDIKNERSHSKLNNSCHEKKVSSRIKNSVNNHQNKKLNPYFLLQNLNMHFKKKCKMISKKKKEQNILYSRLNSNEKNESRKDIISLPSINLLQSPSLKEIKPFNIMILTLEKTAKLIENRLADFRIQAKVINILPGPLITRFELDLAPGIKVARISNISRDLARALSCDSVRIVEVIHGKPYVGLEVSNQVRKTVYLKEVLDNVKFYESLSPLSIALGKDIAGQPIIIDFTKMPHLLIAGTTGSGKSMSIHTMILSILYKSTPKEVRFIMIDPKILELSIYAGIPHLLTDVITDVKNALKALRWCIEEMERRYQIMSTLGVRNITDYNKKIEEKGGEITFPLTNHCSEANNTVYKESSVAQKLPFIVIIIDEFAELMMSVDKHVQQCITRLSQKSRAAGIHLLLATQRPSVDVITGLIKANIPSRIAFRVSSKIDSRTILDQGGAELLLGMGDMLYLPANSSILMRIHGAFVHDKEIHAIVRHWRSQKYSKDISNFTLSESDNKNIGQ